jgi:phage-related protein
MMFADLERALNEAGALDRVELARSARVPGRGAGRHRLCAVRGADWREARQGQAAQGLQELLEIVESFDGDAYRAVYTVRFEAAIYVLHTFQKKSKRGIATPKADLGLIEQRLKEAAADANDDKGQ